MCSKLPAEVFAVFPASRTDREKPLMLSVAPCPVCCAALLNSCIARVAFATAETEPLKLPEMLLPAVCALL
jgi:tRNA(Arg) A34 adenosine deaminase TadA